MNRFQFPLEYVLNHAINLFSAGEYSHVYDAERAWHEHQQRMKEIERR